MKPKIKLFLIFILALTLAACVSSTTTGPGPSVSTSLPASTPTLAPTNLPSSTPTSLPVILPTPASIESLRERLLAEIRVEKEPDEMVFVNGFIWTKTADGHVIQIDPITNTVVADIKVDTTSDVYHYCQGLGTDGQNIWACSAGGDEDNRTVDVVRVDPQTQSVVETFKVGKIFAQYDLPFLHNQIWVLSGNGDKLVGIDVTTNQPNPAIDLDHSCLQLAAINNVLIATCASDNIVLEIDPEKGKTTRQVTIKSPRYIAGNENGIWVLQDNAVLRLDPESLEPVVEITRLFNIGITGHIFVTEDAIWIRQKDGFLYRVDPATNEILEQISIDTDISGGSVLVTSDSIWTTAYDDNLLIRLSRK